MASRSCGSCLLTLTAKVFLVVVNLFFLGLAASILYAALRLRASGWFDILSESHPWVPNICEWSLLGISMLIAISAISGCYGALFRSRCMLLLYAIFVSIGIICFVLLTAGSFFSWFVALSWNRVTVRDPITEERPEMKFNALYCVSEASLICSSASSANWLVSSKPSGLTTDDINSPPTTSAEPHDLRDLFFDHNTSVFFKEAMAKAASSTNDPSRSSIQAVCDSQHVKEQASAKVLKVCEWCGELEHLKTYPQVVHWVNDQCAPTFGSAAFCVDFYWYKQVRNASIMHIDSSIYTSPYEQCRSAFLHDWIGLSKWSALSSAILLIYMTCVLRLTCGLLSQTRRFLDDEDAAVQEKLPLLHPPPRQAPHAHAT